MIGVVVGVAFVLGYLVKGLIPQEFSTLGDFLIVLILGLSLFVLAASQIRRN